MNRHHPANAETASSKRRGRLVAVAAGLLFLLVLAIGTIRNPQFWRSSDRSGDILLSEKQYDKAAQVYADPWRIGTAQYRNGDFEKAAKTFARVPGANGAFNQGNAWLMNGKYDAAIESYNRALGFHPRWKLAEDNMALAVARKKRLDDAGEHRAEESANAYKPDGVVNDLKGQDKPSEPNDMNGKEMSDEELRASWLRRVRTTPGDFLRAKFAYQAAHSAQPSDKEVSK
ncbi:tetratricopeptide repeat protein [Stieleria sp. TO1_6]|uniref:tetratricopeptide repeat protein n=1 Tax=Stieleria tagensis TaxID=2956795 RepID=UPI00209A7DC3|nr:tetratricopeptide repeat protein [Stieleria tagensis]MCO8120772.1 tetratricopeptide repeat protein [Stieleria tagensis]